MQVVRLLAAIAFSGLSLRAATFGRVVPLVGGATDIALDESRNRLYLTSSAQNQVQVYALAQNKFLAAIDTDNEPIGVAISRSGKVLYVTCYADSVVDVIDLTTLTVTNRISLPSRPEGIAVANDERVLISTIGSGATNILLLYDPAPNSAAPLTALGVTPAAPAAPVFPAPSGRAFLAAHSQLRATRDGSLIVGLHTNAASNVGVVFVYQSASATVLRARTLQTGFFTALAISDDGKRILCGANLFDGATMQLLGTMNTANAMYPITPIQTTSLFTAQTNQGGAVFSPDGQTLYTMYNVNPVNAGGNIGQLMITDPDNLLITMGIQTPEFFAGKLVLSADGANAYALSDSGFVALPLSTISQSALAVPATSVLLLTNDQCGVSGTSTSSVTINSPGKVRATFSPQLLQYPGVANQPNPATAPAARSTQTGLSFTFNTALSKGYGTIDPPHEFQVQSTDAINIPDRIRVYQNNRDAEARGTILPIPVGISSGATLTDLVYDAPRQRIYIANSGLNRVEVYDIGMQQFLTPIKVGQLPIALALTPDGATLYVANSGGESIGIVDPDKMVSTGLVAYPPLPFASTLPTILPTAIAAGQSGLKVLMNNGMLWKVIGSTAVPRGVSTIIGSNPNTGLPNPIGGGVMATSAEGRYILLASTNGFVYLYDATVDDFVAGRQLFTTLPTGYTGPITAGPNGQYFVIDGMVLNQALVQVAAVPGFVSAVSAIGNSSFAIYSTPLTTLNTLATTAPSVEIINANTGNPTLQIPALEGPITQLTGGRATIAGRTMAIDSAGAVAYADGEPGELSNGHRAELARLDFWTEPGRERGRVGDSAARDSRRHLRHVEQRRAAFVHDERAADQRADSAGDGCGNVSPSGAVGRQSSGLGIAANHGVEICARRIGRWHGTGPVVPCRWIVRQQEPPRESRRAAGAVRSRPGRDHGRQNQRGHAIARKSSGGLAHGLGSFRRPAVGAVRDHRRLGGPRAGLDRNLSIEPARAGIPHQRRFAAGDDHGWRRVEPEHRACGAHGFGELDSK